MDASGAKRLFESIFFCIQLCSSQGHPKVPLIMSLRAKRSNLPEQWDCLPLRGTGRREKRPPRNDHCLPYAKRCCSSTFLSTSTLFCC